MGPTVLPSHFNLIPRNVRSDHGRPDLDPAELRRRQLPELTPDRPSVNSIDKVSNVNPKVVYSIIFKTVS